jgi:hypothetical protein
MRADAGSRSTECRDYNRLDPNVTKTLAKSFIFPSFNQSSGRGITKARSIHIFRRHNFSKHSTPVWTWNLTTQLGSQGLTTHEFYYTSGAKLAVIRGSHVPDRLRHRHSCLLRGHRYDGPKTDIARLMSRSPFIQAGSRRVMAYLTPES